MTTYIEVLAQVSRLLADAKGTNEMEYLQTAAHWLKQAEECQKKAEECQ